MRNYTRFIVSLIVGVPVLLFFLYTSFTLIMEKNYGAAVVGAVFAYAAFAFVSCLIFNNNCVGGIIATLFSWGFVTMPGLITTFDIEGLVWLICMKILFFFIPLILAIVLGFVGIVVAFVVSPFVYPFALYNSLKKRDVLDVI